MVWPGNYESEIQINWELPVLIDERHLDKSDVNEKNLSLGAKLWPSSLEED